MVETTPVRRNLAIVLTSALLIFFLTSSVQAADSIKIIVNKKVNKLAYLKNGTVVRIFPVATGKSVSLTPEGNFKVVRKIVNPYYSKLKIPGGSPRNPLGARWLGLNALGTSGGTYGIHGTNNPSSIGKYASAGCIRMYNNDVIWLYDNTPLHTEVEIINRDWDLEQKPVNIVINGKKLVSEAGAGPYLDKGRVMVPVRLLAESMGYTVHWDEGKQTVTVSDGQNQVSARVNSTQVTVNGVIRPTDVKPVLKNGRVFLWVRDIAEPFGYRVDWSQHNYTVTLTKN